MLSVLKNHWTAANKALVVDMINTLMSSGHRVVCYEAQALLMLLNDTFPFNKAQGNTLHNPSSKYLINFIEKKFQLYLA